MSIEQLKSENCISNSINFFQWEGNIPIISVQNRSASALISLFGGQVLSYRPNFACEDVLFLSRRAIWDGIRPIRGGIPVCWPWFGEDPEGIGRPSHGFARKSLWKILATESSTDEITKITLGLTNTSTTQAYWSYRFNLELMISVGRELTLELKTLNKSNSQFTVSQALHTYFNIGDIHKTKIYGLSGLSYWDKLTSDQDRNGQNEEVIIDQELDRIYSGDNKTVSISDAAFKRELRISQEGSETTVVWNPWIKKSRKLSDLDPDAYRHFVCVETANVGNDARTVQPDSEHRLKCTIQITFLKETDYKSNQQN